jgi:hypothetical protein
VSPPKRQGRPPLDKEDPSVSVNVRVPGKLYDRMYERAQRERVTIPELIRRNLREPNDHSKKS